MWVGVKGAGAEGIKVSGHAGGTIAASTVEESQQSGVVLSSCSGTRIVACNVDSNSLDPNAVYPGIKLAGCNGSAVGFSKSRALLSSSRQTFGVFVEGGSGCVVGPNDLSPNRGEDGSATGASALLPSRTVRLNGPGHVEFGNYKTEVF